MEGYKSGYLPHHSHLPNGDHYQHGYHDDADTFHQLQPSTGPDDTDQAIPSISSYQDYPSTKPFLYDNYRRDDAPVKAYPESNRRAVMSALKSLQDKIKHLEIERTQAEDNLKTLTTDTSEFRELLNRDHHDLTEVESLPNISMANTTRGTDVHIKLDTAEHRCKLLEQQLDYMRNMVQNAEYDRTDAVRRSGMLEKEREAIEQEDLRAQLGKITDLEREHLKLTATQTLAENKIRELEEKVKEERHYRKVMQSRASEMETLAETNRILMEAGSYDEAPIKSKKTKKKKKVNTSCKCPHVATRPASAKARRPPSAGTLRKPGMEPPDHYRLNLAEIPFISGRSTTPSHSLAANFQEVLSIMKSHNPKLCKSPRNHMLTPGVHFFKDKPTRHRSDKDLTDLLLQLQDEFGKMSYEHQELSQQIRTVSDSRLKEDLERELDSLVATMETKGQQITRLRKHHENAAKKKVTKKTTAPSATTVEIPCRDTDIPLNGHVEVTTTIRAKRGPHSPHATANATTSLNLYKGLKKIQNTLRKDDISWD